MVIRLQVISKARWLWTSKSSQVREYNRPCKVTTRSKPVVHQALFLTTRRTFSNNHNSSRSKPSKRNIVKGVILEENQAAECIKTWPTVQTKVIIQTALAPTRNSWRSFHRTCTRTRNSGLINRWSTRSERSSVGSPKAKISPIKTVPISLWMISWILSRWTVRFWIRKEATRPARSLPKTIACSQQIRIRASQAYLWPTRSRVKGIQTLSSFRPSSTSRIYR